MGKARGFTLIEMIAVMAVMSTLLLVAAAAYNDLIKRNRLLSEVYAFRASVNSARSEALAQRVYVIVCRSSDGSTCSAGDWNAGYIAFTDDDGVGNPSDPNEIILSHSPSDQLNIKYSAVANRVRFDSRGYALGFQGTLTVCDDRGAQHAIAAILAPVGSVRAAVDDPNDPDSIVNINDGGVNVVCTS